MKIIKLSVGQMKANCFIIHDDNSDAIIVDPGDDAEFIISTIQKNDLSPKLIVATHGHVDHVMAVLEIQLAFGIPFYMNKKDEFLLKRMASSAMKFLQFDPGPTPKVNIDLVEGSNITVGEINLEVIETPGHTPGSVCLYSKETEDLFVGDLIFEDGMVGRTDLKYSDKDELKKSIRQILDLPEDTNVHSGHGESFTISEWDHF